MLPLIDEQPRRLALLVEDDQISLDIRREMLNGRGFATVAVQNEEEALREFAASPGVDLVITDIRLRPERRTDKSGVVLARRIKAISAKVPIVGYSAAFAEKELSDDDRAPFTSYYARGGSEPAQIIRHIEEWKVLADEFREQRQAEARGRLRKFREKYGQPDPVYSTLRFLVPNRLLTGEDLSCVEDVLRNAGFQLRIIDRGYARPTIEDETAEVRSRILVWLRREADAVVAEVYGFSEFYSFGDTEEDAIRNVLLLLDGFHRDLSNDQEERLGSNERTRDIEEFLKSVFG